MAVTYFPGRCYDVSMLTGRPYLIDLNNDGNIDVLQQYNYNNAVYGTSIVPNTLSGEFDVANKIDINTSLYESTQAIIDVTGDGRKDLITFLNNDIRFWVPDGNYNYTLTDVLSSGSAKISQYDFNGDSINDIVITDSLDKWVFLGRSTGGYNTVLTNSQNAPFNPQLADLNNDGHLDYFYVYNYYKVYVEINNGDGTFAAPIEYSTGPVPRSVAAADINGDGKLDLLTPNNPRFQNQYIDGSISILIGKGDGTFENHYEINVGPQYYDLCLDDFNDDGIVDIAATGSESAVFLNDGSGVFTQSHSFKSEKFFFCAKDVDNDGLSDLLSDSDYGFFVFKNLGGGIFDSFSTADSGQGATVVADFDNDSNQDAITTAYSMSYFLKGNGDGTFQSPSIFTMGNTYLAKDIDSDGNIDVLGVNYGVDKVEIYLGNGDATFQSQISFSTGQYPLAATTGDLNKDGKVDIITANQNTNNVSILLNDSNETIFTFADKVDYSVGGAPRSVSVGHINNDSYPDIVTGQTKYVSSYPHYTFTILYNNTDGTFGSRTDIDSHYKVFDILINDFNKDGYGDIAVLTDRPDGYTSGVDVYLNDADGTFTRKPNTIYNDGQKLRMADINNDGQSDLVVVFEATYGSGNDGIAVLLGDGQGNMSYPQYYNGMDLSLCLADLNNDGEVDVVTGARSEGVCILLNRGSTQLITDIYPDGEIDLKDFSILANYWQTSNSTADIAPEGSPDGIVDLLDLSRLVEDWLR